MNVKKMFWSPGVTILLPFICLMYILAVVVIFLSGDEEVLAGLELGGLQVINDDGAAGGAVGAG